MPETNERAIKLSWGLFARAVLQNVVTGEISVFSILPNVTIPSGQLKPGEEWNEITLAPIVYIAQFERPPAPEPGQIALKLWSNIDSEPLPMRVDFAPNSQIAIMVTPFNEVVFKVEKGKELALELKWMDQDIVIGQSLLPVNLESNSSDSPANTDRD